MKRIACIFLLALALCAPTVIATAQQNKAELMYQQALYEMEGKGNYLKAIELLKQVMTQYPKEKTTAAKALLNIGRSYEKLGNAEARAAYERVVRDFADQAEIVAQARVRLAALGAGTAARSAEITIRRVWAGPGANGEGSPSPDGRYLSYTDWETPDLAVHDLVTGENRRVTKKKPGVPYAYPDNSIFSPNGKQIAYRWFIEGDACELRTIALDGSGERVLYRDKEKYPSRLDWSPDGRHILTKLGERPVMIVVTDGSIQDLVIENPGMMCFSPDGGYIAYDSPQTKDVRQSDVYVYERKTQRTSLLVGHPANDRLLGWSPDGRHVLFASDRRGTRDAWLIAVSGGQPLGEPMLVRSDIGGLGEGKGFTRAGAYFFSNWGESRDVFSTRLDIKTGKSLSSPAEVAGSYLGSNWGPDFSRDGKSLAYVTGQGEIVIQSLETPDKKNIKPSTEIMRTERMEGLRWAPDGRSFVATGVDRQGREGLLRINSPTGEATLWFKPAHPWSQAFDVSRDGRKVFYQGTTTGGSLYVWDSESGEESQLQVGVKAWSLAVSPDGKQLAYFRSNAAESKGLFVMPSTGGTPRLLVRVADSRGIVAWSPDCRQLLYAVPSKSTANGTPATLRYELWRVPSQGGEPQQLDLTVVGMLTSLRVHPDGQRIVYKTLRSNSEVWVMENFLPGLEKEKSLTVRKIGTGPTVDMLGVLSPDGKYIRRLEQRTGDVVQFDVESGQTSRISNKGPQSKRLYYVEGYAFSRDGKQIAFDIENFDSTTKSWGNHLRIRNQDGSNLRTLYSETAAQPFDWSPDAGSILALRNISGEANNQLVLISTADGSVRVLRNVAASWYMLTKACFSPDGRFVAFSLVNEGSPPHSDVYLMTTDGLNEVVVAGHPAEDKLLEWTPDGRSLLFLSDRSGTWDVWTVHITGGKQQGEPELLKKDFGRYSDALGFAPDGSLYYRTTTPLGRLYYGEIDLETGKVLVPPAPVTTRYNGPPSRTTWSPDGKRLLYVSLGRAIGNGNNNLTIRSAETGEERFLSTRLRYVWDICWAPDSRAILACGTTVEGIALFRVDAETGETTKLADGRWAPRISQDGKIMVFMDKGGIRRRNLDTGEESAGPMVGTEVLKSFDDVSPDGQEVVFQEDGAVKTVPLNGGEPRELFRSSLYYVKRWTRDGRHIIAQALDRSTGHYAAISEIWRIPVQGGTPLKLDLNIPKMEDFALHPDNRRFAFSVNEGSKSELWVLENFLPKGKKQGGAGTKK